MSRFCNYSEFINAGNNPSSFNFRDGIMAYRLISTGHIEKILPGECQKIDRITDYDNIDRSPKRQYWMRYL